MPDLVSHLAQLIVEDNAILFVGSALLGEQGKQAAVEQIAAALATRADFQGTASDLSAVAEYFQDRKGRGELLRALQEELAKLALQPDPIHNLVADAVLPTTKVITTRWDQLLERALEQYGKEYVLIVRDKDVPFFDETKITLVKMQGDIGQPESLVVTEEDIEAFFDRLPTLSDVIRAFFATKTLVFLGYDLNSELFKRFYRKLLRNVGSFSRTVYAIVPEPLDEATTLHWQQRNVQIHAQPPTLFLQALGQAVKALGPATRPVPQQPPLPERPYKGPASFTEADERIFRGRSEETMRLLNRVLANRTVLLYGESGSGKTSLVQAGLAPDLARRGALLVIETADGTEPLVERLRKALREAASAYGLLLGAADDLPTMIQRVQPALQGPLVLVVDQVEQLFMLPEGDALAALRALQALVEDERMDVRLLLVLREDFLGRLHALESQLPGLVDARFRLERLSREAARSAIEEPAREFGIVWEPALVRAAAG